jgi:hypothetical protein
MNFFLKKTMYFIIIIISINSISAQYIVNVQIIPEMLSSADSLQVISEVSFTFGSGETCPNISSYSYQSFDTTVILNLFYNTSGMWPQVGCSTIDTLDIGNYNIGNYNLILKTNKIFYSDTTFNFHSDTIPFTIQEANSILLYSNMQVVTYPNPSNNILHVKWKNSTIKHDNPIFYITDIYGITMLSGVLVNSKIDLSNIPSGMYFLNILTSNRVNSTKIIVQ